MKPAIAMLTFLVLAGSVVAQDVTPATTLRLVDRDGHLVGHVLTVRSSAVVDVPLRVDGDIIVLSVTPLDIATNAFRWASLGDPVMLFFENAGCSGRAFVSYRQHMFTRYAAVTTDNRLWVSSRQPVRQTVDLRSGAQPEALVGPMRCETFGSPSRQSVIEVAFVADLDEIFPPPYSIVAAAARRSMSE